MDKSESRGVFIPDVIVGSNADGSDGGNNAGDNGCNDVEQQISTKGIKHFVIFACMSQCNRSIDHQRGRTCQKEYTKEQFNTEADEMHTFISLKNRDNFLKSLRHVMKHISVKAEDKEGEYGHQ